MATFLWNMHSCSPKRKSGGNETRQILHFMV